MPKKEVSILDVGHGNCTVLTDDNGIAVFDAGPGSSLLEFLREEGINKIDVILISHSDKDHIEGLVALLDSDSVEIGRVRLNSDGSKGSKLWDDLINSLADYNKRGEIDFDIGLTSKNTDEFNQGSIRIEILAPSLYLAAKSPGSRDRQNRLLTPNSNSVVIRLSQDDKPALLIPADIDYVGFQNMLDEGIDCKAPIVIFPHHGGLPGGGDAAEFSEQFCQQTEPEIIIFSLGRGIHNTPRPEIIETIRKTSPHIKILCTQLSTHCSADIPPVGKNHLSNKFSRGRLKNLCCAGTLTIDLENIENLLTPSIESHHEFIKAIPGALCMMNRI